MKPSVADRRYKIHCLRIVPLWGATVYLTDHVRDVVIGVNTYKTDSGYEFSGMALEDNMSPGVLDLTGVANIAGIDMDEVIAGVFDGARVYAFATTWNAPIVDEEPLGLALLGKTKLDDDRYTIEMMMLIDALNQTVGQTYTANCQKEFGGQGFAGCKVALGPITVTGTLSHVTSNAIFRDSTRTETADYFGEGTIAFTTGQNAGLKPVKVKSHVGLYSVAITAITKAPSAVVTVGAHAFVSGNVVAFSGVVGMTQINGLTGTVTATGATTITVNINSAGFSTYTSGGTAALLNGTIEVHEAFHYPVAVGDAYTLVPGCRHRLEDCRDKWNNIINGGMFSFIATTSTYSQIGGN